MAQLKKITADTYVVPSLSDDPAYAAVLQRQAELNAMLSKLISERRDLDKKIEEQPKSPYSAGVSRLLGEDEGAAPHLRKRRAEVLGEITDVETALVVIRKRLEEARNSSSRSICDSVREEYQRRLGVLCDAARALEAARQDHDALLDRLDAEDIRKDFLRPVIPHFMGDRHEGRAHYFLRECAEAGYHV